MPSLFGRSKSKTRAGKRKLTKKQLAQRRYASAMRGIRARAARSTRGRGAIRSRKAATTLRRKLKLKG